MTLKRPTPNEFALIARHFAPLSRGFAGAYGLRDDAAVITPAPGCELVVQTDVIVGGIDFPPDEPADLVARKALRVNLSDLAAKGAVPRAYLLDLILPNAVDETWIAAFAAGLRHDQAEYGIHLIGGDMSATPGPITVAVTALGETPIGQIMRRGGARRGDAVFATGSIGDASAQWHVETGNEARLLVAYGMTADLIVAGRGGTDNVTARSVLEAALLETGRPLLIPGSGPAAAFIGGTVAIGWKPRPQAARAVMAAMPFLARAKEALVVTVEEGEPEGDTERLIQNLSWHGLTASALVLSPGERGAARTLLDVARDQAQLLVIGGYGHSRLREWVFGGFTQEVLASAPLPVLMAH